MSLPVVGLGVGRLLRPYLPHETKLMPYECGVDPEGDARGRFSVRFYFIAILFVIFDVETIFLFPWASKYGIWSKEFGIMFFLSMLSFLVIVTTGYVYAWKKGDLEWE